MLFMIQKAQLNIHKAQKKYLFVNVERIDDWIRCN